MECTLQPVWLVFVIVTLAIVTSPTESATDLSFEDKENTGSNDVLIGTPILYINNENGPICATSTSENDAKVICRQLGWTEDSSVRAPVDRGFRVVRLRYLACRGSETRVDDCPGFNWGNYSTCTQVATIRCSRVKEGFDWRILQYIGYGLIPLFIGISMGIRHCIIKKHHQNQVSRGRVDAVTGAPIPYPQTGQAYPQVVGAPPPPLGGAAVPPTSDFMKGSVPPPPSYNSVVGAYPAAPAYPTTTGTSSANTFSNMDNYRTQFS